jgi:hypothetical protein
MTVPVLEKGSVLFVPSSSIDGIASEATATGLQRRLATSMISRARLAPVMRP